MPEAPKEIIRLVKKFEDNHERYKNPSYNEEQLKQEFINPFFKALGWDMENEEDAAPQYRDVIFEDSIEVSGSKKAPDYCFTMAGQRKFFVEAKKPSININKDREPAFQVRRYGWSADLPVSILTDFEEFSIYESRSKPKKSDSPSKYRIKYFKFTDYVEKWDYIYERFSKEAVRKGWFDKFAETDKKKRGTTSVDDEFLKEMEEWRELLARNIANRNKELSIDDLNFAVQQIIDRIVFLRNCEDRGIEKYERIRNLLDNKNIYNNFCELCKKADEKYNSGLFHFKEEKGRPSYPDKLTLNLNIDDGVLKKIITNLYYPDSPYVFSVIPPEILGHVYEQFLGKVIRLTPSHQAKVEEKPEVKKAGGIYYTPKFIVDYIVENTVRKLCKGKTPKTVSKLKILDPACGSGSFLLGAYNSLLDWHLEYYIKQKDKKKLTSRIYPGKHNEWYLTIQEKKRILLNNIYGVDLDPQAVEVTKLSLLLKVLEDEHKEVIDVQSQFGQRALPDLDGNIKCGNSLIGNEIYEDSDLDESDIKRINPFDWEKEFGTTKFDAVIGNPPYIRIQAMKEWAPIEVEFYKKNYVSASKGNYDIYIVFVERGLELLNEKGRLGFILPHKFFNAKYGESLRGLIAEGGYLDKIVHFGDLQIFNNASTYTCLLFLDKKPNKRFEFVKVEDLEKWRRLGECVKGKVSLKKVSDNEWNFIVGECAELFEKLSKMPVKLGDISKRIFQGLITGADNVFILENLENGVYFSKAANKSYKLENNLLHPLCKGSVNIRRYHISNLTKSILFPYEFVNGKATLIKKEPFSKEYPNTWKYLLSNRNKLESRERGKWKNERWYAFGRTQNMNEMEQIKLLTPSIASSASFTLDKSEFYYFIGSGGGGGGGYGITLNSDNINDYMYILGLLNSNLLDKYLKSYSSQFRGGYYAYNKQYIEKLPIHAIDLDNLEDVTIYDKVVILVEKILKLHENLTNTKTPNEKEMIQRQIDATDKQIDRLIYELYDLTPEEIRIIEDSLD
ncbi:MAG: restriction endonuclease subunit M [Methanobacterium sp. BRmetb2]|jgi:type I restriction-modification system DNA methylase subunit|nr:MAG: restriction endonuclease subunit M [Methanobacterium sp. BRmetb2]